MTAGTVVITGGILASVILLCIIGVLCYCRLQYYCCKKDELRGEAEEDPGRHPHSHFPCHDCSPAHLDGMFPPYVAPAYSPYGSPYIIRTADTMCNGRERDSFTPTHYAEAGPLLVMGTPNLSRGLQALSTQV
ncbi:protein FAM163A [Rana temporaria]|uniref:protein FAM163A n=1 Tax=Rana temporaria TaxID=8407 RepID=UPI001AAC8A49|nr:protein FAM163A [Rana temporaria]XP_040216144.1 protein FAM163A [Rana temporaria]